VIAGNADALFVRLTEAKGRPDLATEYASHEKRGAHQAELDAEIARWTATMPSEELVALLQRHDVPVGLINRAPDLLQDPHIAARDMIVRLAAGYERDVPMANVVPRLSRTPGAIQHPGPRLGEHTDEVLRELAGWSDDQIKELRDAGAVE
jgi:formyl-CoA transferase